MTTARDVIAKAIYPDWFGQEVDGVHPLDNYPNQHLKYQQAAYEKADRSIADLLSAPDSVRQELVALLNPWRPMNEAPKDRPIDGMVCIPRAQYEALMAASTGLMREFPSDSDAPDCNCRECRCGRIADALRAAGILEGK